MDQWTGHAGQLGAQRADRDKYIIIQRRAIDARYASFLIGLAQQTRGTNLSLDLVTLGLTGGASFAAEKTANILSSGATAIVGGRAAFNKDLFYERTLPALIDEMNAARTRARGPLSAGLSKPADQYTLSMADSDLAQYEAAPNLDTALQQITSAAAQHADAEEARYSAEFRGCLPKPEVFVPRSKMVAYLDAKNNAAGAMQLAKIAANLGLNIASQTPNELHDAILQYISTKVCDLTTAQSVANAWDPNILK